VDKTTAAIRDMYEQYPYPAGSPVNRVGSDVALLLSYGSVRPTSGQRWVLDAGCGRGLGLLGAATLQPDVQFVGADLNRVALADAQAQADARGLHNLRFVECDLMTLAGLDIPPRGFDVIHSSGVLHHLSDPAAGLVRLRKALAPHGLINLMVYGRYGREPLMQIAAAIGLLFPDETPLAARLPVARVVAALAREHVLPGTKFMDTAAVDDVEFVDRVLNVNETSYDVANVMQLVDAAGLRFLRWIEPADWDPWLRLPDGSLRQQVAALEPVAQWRFLELLFRAAGLELVIGHAGNTLRTPLAAADVASARFRLNPEVVISTGVRHTPAGLRTEQLGVTVRTRPPLPISAGPAAAALLLLKDEVREWSGEQLVRAQAKLGTAADVAVAVVLELAKHEILARVD
jgi:SAM-dependent methyltransferase